MKVKSLTRSGIIWKGKKYDIDICDDVVLPDGDKELEAHIKANPEMYKLEKPAPKPAAKKSTKKVVE